MMNIVLFDIDGTLTRSGGAGKKAFDQAFEKMYRIEAASEGLHFAGKTDPNIIQEIFRKHFDRIPDPSEIIRIKNLYLKIMEEEVCAARPYRPIDGIIEILKHLSGTEHFLLGLATGNFKESAFLKLQSAGLKEFFSYGGFGSDSHNRTELTRLGIERGKKLISSGKKFGRAFVIGDTIHDIRAGKETGAKTIAMLTGGGKQDDFKSCKPDYILPGYNPIESFLEIMNGSIQQLSS